MVSRGAVHLEVIRWFPRSSARLCDIVYFETTRRKVFESGKT